MFNWLFEVFFAVKFRTPSFSLAKDAAFSSAAFRAFGNKTWYSPLLLKCGMIPTTGRHSAHNLAITTLNNFIEKITPRIFVCACVAPLKLLHRFFIKIIRNASDTDPHIVSRGGTSTEKT